MIPDGYIPTGNGYEKNGMLVTAPTILLPLIVMSPIAPSCTIAAEPIVLLFTTDVNFLLIKGVRHNPVRHNLCSLATYSALVTQT